MWHRRTRALSPSTEADLAAQVTGCHGGAGTTTVTHLLGHGAVECSGGSADGRLVLVTHGNAHGALCAARTIGMRRDRVKPAVLVVVADGRGPEPAAAQWRFRLIGGVLPVVRIPFVLRWRYVDDPFALSAPRSVQCAIRRVHGVLLEQGCSVELSGKEVPPC